MTATSVNVERNRAARMTLVLAGTDSAHGGTALPVILRSQNVACAHSFHDADILLGATGRDQVAWRCTVSPKVCLARLVEAHVPISGQNVPLHVGLPTAAGITLAGATELN